MERLLFLLLAQAAACSETASNSEQVVRVREFLICQGAHLKGCLWSGSAGWRFAPSAALSWRTQQSETQTSSSTGVTL